MAINILEPSLLETCNSINTVRTIRVIYGDKRELAIIGKVKYIVRTDREAFLETIERMLTVADTLGIGSARASGFGYVRIDVVGKDTQ